MKKYRYFMSGMFYPTDKEEYEINIPSPFSHNSEEDAMADGNLGYRFIWDDIKNEPIIAIFQGENFSISKEGNKKTLNTWVTGNIIHTYNYDEFKENGGYIRMLKPECKGLGFIDSNTDFLDTDKTFLDVFPDMGKQKLYYIDNEAYCISEE